MPSGEKATDITDSVWPVRVAVHFKVSIFQTLTDISLEPEASFLPFLEKAIDHILFLCPASRFASHYKVNAFHTLMTPFGPPVTIFYPLGE